MEQEQIQQFIDNKTPVFIDRSSYKLVGYATICCFQ